MVRVFSRALDHDYLDRHFGDFVAGYASQIDFVADRLASKDVKDLERLATALYVTLEGAQPRERAARLNTLKPHVSLEEARIAVEQLDVLADEAVRLGLSTALPFRALAAS